MVPGNTAADRYIISFEGDGHIGQLDRVHTLLMALWEDYFGIVRHEPIGEYEYQIIGDTLYLLTDSLFNIILDMALENGCADFRGVGPFLAKAKAAEKAIECNDLVDKARDIQRGLTEEKREAYKAQVNALTELPDDEAIPLLKELIKRGLTPGK